MSDTAQKSSNLIHVSSLVPLRTDEISKPTNIEFYNRRFDTQFQGQLVEINKV